MSLNIFEKISYAFQSIFSSFMSIELFIIGFLLFIFFAININKNEKIIKMFAVCLYLLFFFLICYFYSDYTAQSIDGVIKYIMHYIYFPSLAMYFVIMVFVTIGIFYTMFSKKISKFLKYVNTSVFGLLYIFYIQVIGQVADNRIYFTTDVSIYRNESILCFIQVSNLILFLWIIFILFYVFYQFCKRKYSERFDIT